MDTGLTLLLAWLAVFGGATYALWATGRRRYGRLHIYPLALVLRLGVTLEGGEGRAWRVASKASWAAVAVMVYSILVFYVGVLSEVYRRYLAGASVEGAAIIPFIPGVTIAWKDMPVIAAALGVAVLVHESAHALVARAEGLRVKNAGLALVAFIPAAFVELDEEQFRRAKLSVKAKVYSAGVASNMAMALVFAYVLSALATGALVVDVKPGSPAAHAGLQAGDVIIYVNGSRVESIEDLSRVLAELGVKDPEKPAFVELTVVRNGSTVNLTVFKPAGEQFLGIIVVTEIAGPAPLLYALWMINYALALINAAPLFVTDGGQLLREALSALAGRTGLAVSMGIQASTLILVASLIGLAQITLPY